jgi:hypothetical protein
MANLKIVPLGTSPLRLMLDNGLHVTVDLTSQPPDKAIWSLIAPKYSLAEGALEEINEPEISGGKEAGPEKDDDPAPVIGPLPKIGPLLPVHPRVASKLGDLMRSMDAQVMREDRSLHLLAGTVGTQQLRVLVGHDSPLTVSDLQKFAALPDSMEVVLMVGKKDGE